MTHRERLTAPVAWWIGATGFGLTCGWLVFVATTPVIAAVAAAAAAAVGYGFVAAYGALQVAVDAELHAGRAHISPEFLGEVEILDRTAYREVMGPRADVRAWLATRPWIDTGVRVTIQDPADPHPYWLLGSRRPDHLAAAIEDLRQTGRRTSAGGAPQKGV
ncbi:MAG: DUF3093 domain-containing protein [Aeromicrobium sp.]|uniref:DUF3093 domain-containing protein n=1 Tax=Aeromicrobium sp. TaxID=1871063 RepID=UPI0025C5F231|nr:DUF3093 domain-containing protein [Aeromicrobium sp.]MCK5891169.1 DUF3093 domain-containing protein [Aeromicrobium sp.]MDF1705518.1 DUF3093 domain-containing protein [Aeromicrobium sp.]